MLDCMVDIETTGTLPDRSAILQIAAAQFNLETGEVHHNFFNRCLIMPPTRCWDEGTREWWLKNKDVYWSINQRAEPADVVVKDFYGWALPARSLRFWGKPSHFDFPFIASYFHDHGFEKNPFHYRDANDMNTWIRARYFPEAPHEPEMEFEGDEHDAIWDVLHQIKLLMWHYENTK